MQFKGRSKPGPMIDITPLVDTAFNLMIFFAVSMNFITSPGISVKLPKATAEQVAAERTQITIAITREGLIYLDGRMVVRGELYSRLKAAPAEQKERGLVVIQADEKSFHGNVVEVMDIVKRAGFSRLAIATQPREEGGG